MDYFIRFTETIEKDLERGTSIITTDNNRISNGLCAFYGGKTIEESLERAVNIFGKYIAEKGDSFHIVKARENTREKAGTIGTLFYAEGAELVYSGVL